MFGRLLPEPSLPIGGIRLYPVIAPALRAIQKHKWIAALAGLALIAAIVVGSLSAVRSRAAASYQTTPVVQQSLSQTVTASGTVNPQNTVNVGTQVSGTISQIYVDYNSRVHKGQVLARLDSASSKHN